MKALSVVEFIRKHSDWEDLLSESPYSITITRAEFGGRKLVMFKYSQIESDFRLEIVRECRGLILEEGTWNIVSYPFRKFMNYGEVGADEIDWNTAVVSEKIDGSLIKIVRLDSGLLISTNGTILADSAPVAEQLGCKFKSFGEIVRSILVGKFGGDYCSKFKSGFTYMFELVSPWTRVVIPYNVEELYYLGCRDNKTLLEHGPEEDMGLPLDAFSVPRVFSFGTFSDCIQNAEALPWSSEGYVVRDGEFNRVKVKSPAWIQVHHLRGNDGSLSKSRCLDLIRANECSEVLTYFPELRQEFEQLEGKYHQLVGTVDETWRDFQLEFPDAGSKTRRELAAWILDHFGKFSGAGFCLLDGKVRSAGEWFGSCPTDRVLKYMEEI